MSMVTTCPACGTSFRVTPQQLQAHHGTVRCGHCVHVFDGFQSLSSPSGDAGNEGDVHPPPLGAGTLDLSEPAPQFVMPAEAEAPKRRGLVFGILLMSAVLAGQAAYFWRDDIIVAAPWLRPPLEKLCASLQCSVALPQRPQEITIEGSDMQAPDPTTPGFLVLTATLRNRAVATLSYPALDVVLTDNDDHTVARRVFSPSEYLNNATDVHAGIAPNAEVTVRLNLDIGDLNATGFRIDRFTPAS